MLISLFYALDEPTGGEKHSLFLASATPYLRLLS